MKQHSRPTAYRNRQGSARGIVTEKLNHTQRFKSGTGWDSKENSILESRGQSKRANVIDTTPKQNVCATNSLKDIDHVIAQPEFFGMFHQRLPSSSDVNTSKMEHQNTGQSKRGMKLSCSEFPAEQAVKSPHMSST